MKSETTFSCIKLLTLLEAEIEKINNYPLTKDNFTIQQDAYKRLGSLNEEDLEEQPEAYEIFAELESARKEKDSDLRFAVSLNALGIILNIEATEAAFFEYSCFKNENEAAKQIVTLLRMLSNGQIAALITNRNGRYCATELLIFEKGESKPTVLFTIGEYRMIWKKNDETGYESQIMRNSFITEQVEVPKDAFFIDYDDKGKLLQKGRIFKSNELTPLTKKDYHEALEQIGNRLTGQQKDEDETQFIMRHWEFWAMSAFVGLSIFFASLNSYLPKFFSDMPFIIAPIATTVGAFLATLIIIRKNESRALNPDNIPHKVEEKIKSWLGDNGYAICAAGLALILFATCYMPIYILHGSTEAINFWKVAEFYAPAYIAPILLLAASYLAFLKGKLSAILYLSCILIGEGIMIFVNFAKTNANVDTPEPYTSIAIISYLVLPIVASCMVLSRIKQRSPAEAIMSSSGESAEDFESDIAPKLDTKAIAELQKKAGRARNFQITLGYIASIAIAISAYLYKDIPNESVDSNNRLMLIGMLCLVSLLMLVFTILFHTKALQAKIYGWILYALGLSLFIGWNSLILDGADEGSDIAWILMFCAGVSTILTSTATDTAEQKLASAFSDEQPEK